MKQKHYRRPPRVGERCLVDGVETYAAFDADLIDFRILARSVDAHYGEVPPEEPAYYYTQMSAKPLETEFYVGGASDDEAQINLSRLVEASKHCVLRKEGSDFEYPAILTGYEMEHTGVEHYLLVTMNFTARLRKPLVDCELTGSGTVYNEGNLASGYRLTVHPHQDMASVTVAGMTLKKPACGQGLYGGRDRIPGDGGGGQPLCGYGHHGFPPDAAGRKLYRNTGRGQGDDRLLPRLPVRRDEIAEDLRQGRGAAICPGRGGLLRDPCV